MTEIDLLKHMMEKRKDILLLDDESYEKNRDEIILELPDYSSEVMELMHGFIFWLDKERAALQEKGLLI